MLCWRFFRRVRIDDKNVIWVEMLVCVSSCTILWYIIFFSKDLRILHGCLAHLLRYCAGILWSSFLSHFLMDSHWRIWQVKWCHVHSVRKIMCCKLRNFQCTEAFSAHFFVQMKKSWQENLNMRSVHTGKEKKNEWENGAIAGVSFNRLCLLQLLETFICRGILGV